MSSSARKLAFADPPSPSHGLAPIEADDGQSVATSMSAMDVDEEYDDDDDGDDDDEEDYYDDTVSTYARSHYPNMTFADAPIEVDGADQYVGGEGGREDEMVRGRMARKSWS
jgi:hypothetical protein